MCPLSPDLAPVERTGTVDKVTRAHNEPLVTGSYALDTDLPIAVFASPRERATFHA